MVGGCTPVSVRCSWNARSSSGVAVSGERPRKVASLLTARMYSRCVSGTNLRMLMSSSMRWRSGLMGLSLIGSSCLEVGVLDPSILKTERPPVTRARSNSYCGRRNTPDRAATTLPRERVRSLARSGHWLKQQCPKSAHAPQQLPALFDHLVGTLQERFRYHEAERLGGFEIDD